MTETITITTGVKNASLRLVQSDGKWYILPVGFSGIHLTPQDTEGILEAFNEAVSRANALNQMSHTNDLF